MTHTDLLPHRPAQTPTCSHADPFATLTLLLANPSAADTSALRPFCSPTLLLAGPSARQPPALPTQRLDLMPTRSAISCRPDQPADLHAGRLAGRLVCTPARSHGGRSARRPDLTPAHLLHADSTHIGLFHTRSHADPISRRPICTPAGSHSGRCPCCSAVSAQRRTARS